LTVALAIPLSPLGAWFGFRAPAGPVLIALAAIVVAYLACAELLKGFAIGPSASGTPNRRRFVAAIVPTGR
jgi:Mg2+-importing ATPase